MNSGYPGKRALDIGIGLAAIVPAGLISMIAALFIVAETRANPLFIQRRVGRHKRPFWLVKLRTMSPTTGDHPSHLVARAQVTRVGRILRSTKIDELPQLYNVVRGEMSLVGPRPCLPSQTELIEERDRRGVYTLRPGITGPAQVANIDMSTPIRLAEADSAYLTARSLRTDMSLLLRTALGSGQGDRTAVR